MEKNTLKTSIYHLIQVALERPGVNLVSAAGIVFAQQQLAAPGQIFVIKELSLLPPTKRRLVQDIVKEKTGAEIVLSPDYAPGAPGVVVSPAGEKPIIHNLTVGDIKDPN